MRPEIFKAYDIRGRYPDELNESVIFEIAARLGKFFAGSRKRTVIVAGCDARISSPSLLGSAVRGLRETKGVRVVSAGLVTTPMLYFLVNSIGADGGVMITASHNPSEYNGLKVVGKRAVPLSGKEIHELLQKLR